MKKLVWILCFMLLLGLLAGCRADTENTLSTVTTEPTGTVAPDGTQPSGNTAPTGTTVPQATEPVDIRPLPPENPGNSLIEYDPDRQIYIASENVYMDYYADISGFSFFQFDIYSRQPLDPDEISVTFPVNFPITVNEYTVMVDHYPVEERKPEIVLNNGSGKSSDNLPYHVYLTYRGETFEKGKAVSAANLISGRYEVEDSEGNFVSAANVLAGKFKLKEGEEIEQRYRDFASLTGDDLPQFYVYNIDVDLYNVTDLKETVVLDKLEITIGDEVYEAKLGCVRRFPREAFPTEARVVSEMGFYTNTIQLYNDGVFQLVNVFQMEEAPEDITITGLRIAEEATRILDVNVSMNSGGQYMEMQWDGVSPIYLYKGDSISIDAVVKNEHAGKLLNYLVNHTIVEYTDSNNEQLCAVCSQVSILERNECENYAIIFDGLDLEPYYRNYFYKHFFQWVDEYRDK